MWMRNPEGMRRVILRVLRKGEMDVRDIGRWRILWLCGRVRRRFSMVNGGCCDGRFGLIWFWG